MSRPTKMQYVSTVRGVEEQQANANYVYYGLVFEVPAEMLLPENHASYARITDSHMKAVHELIEEQTNDRFVVGDVLERYEVFSADESNVLIMFRVPFRVRVDYRARVPMPRVMQLPQDGGELVITTVPTYNRCAESDSERHEIGIEAAQEDSTGVPKNHPHPKCPTCGHVFRLNFLVPWEHHGVCLMGSVEVDGEPHLAPLDEVECECGYVLHCDHEPPGPPHWWGQERRDGPRHGLLPAEFVDSPRQLVIRYGISPMSTDRRENDFVQLDPQRPAAPGLALKLNPSHRR